MSNMEYEFEYFYEPALEDGPIRQLYVTVELCISEEEHPANPLVPVYAVSVVGLKIHDRMGLNVTTYFDFLRPKLVDLFLAHYKQKAVDRFKGDDL